VITLSGFYCTFISTTISTSTTLTTTTEISNNNLKTIHFSVPDCIGCKHELVIVDPNNGGSLRGFSVLVQLGVQLPEGFDGRVGEQLVDFGVRLESGKKLR
jgi:hypothetical protein